MAQAIQRAPAKTKPHKCLRELGVYRLPDGKEFVVSTLYSGGCHLYSLHAWELYLDSEYLIDEQGRLFRRGAPTPWRVTDLQDTGRTTAYPRPRIL